MELRFSSEEKALQYLADITGKRIKVANESDLNNAIKRKDKKAIKEYIDAGAEPNTKSLNDAIKTKDKEIIKLVIDLGVKPDDSSLYLAIKYTEDKEIIKMMLDAGAAKPNTAWEQQNLGDTLYDLSKFIKDKEIRKMIEEATPDYPGFFS